MLMGRDRDGDGRQKKGTGNCADISWILRDHTEIKQRYVYFSHPVERKDTYPHSKSEIFPPFSRRQQQSLVIAYDSSHTTFHNGNN